MRRSDDSRLAGFGSGFGVRIGYFPEFGFGSVSALRVRIRIGSAGPGSDSDRFRRARFGFGSDPPPQVRIRIGYRFGSDSASEPGACPSYRPHHHHPPLCCRHAHQHHGNCGHANSPGRAPTKRLVVMRFCTEIDNKSRGTFSAYFTLSYLSINHSG